MDATPTTKPLRKFPTPAVLTVIALLMGVWVACSIHWIRERRAFLKGTTCEYTNFDVAPQLLWIFGEQGMSSVWVSSENAALVERGRQLFPEAQVSVRDFPIDETN